MTTYAGNNRVEIKEELIEVTQEDISNGVKGDCFKCAVALAIRRKLSPNWGCVVKQHGFDVIWNPRPGKVAEGKLPTEIHAWIYDFDEGRPVKPISFVLKYKIS